MLEPMLNSIYKGFTKGFLRPYKIQIYPPHPRHKDADCETHQVETGQISQLFEEDVSDEGGCHRENGDQI